MGSSDDDRLCRLLLVDRDELRQLRARLRAAGRGRPPTNEKAAALGVSARELEKLREVLRNAGVGATPLVRATVRTILSNHEHRRADPTVYVVPGSSVFHLTVGCESAQSARLKAVPGSEAKSGGRRVCKRCKAEWDLPGLQPIDTAPAQIEESEPPTPRKKPNAAKGPQATKKKVTRPRGPKRTPREIKEAKRARDRAEAERAGITVDELRARRRAQHEENRRRKQRGGAST